MGSQRELGGGEAASSDTGREGGPQYGEAREALLRAGVSILAGATSTPAEKLTVSALADTAGLSPGAFYYHWRDLDGFFVDLVGQVTRDRPKLEAEQLRAVLLEGMLYGGIIEAVKRGSKLSYESGTSDEAWRAEIRLTSINSPKVNKALRGKYEGYMRDYVQQYSQLLEIAGLEPRPPFTVESMAVVITALLEGLLLRHLTDPGAVEPIDEDWTLLGTTILALLSSVTMPKDGHSAHQTVSELAASSFASSAPVNVPLRGQRNQASRRGLTPGTDSSHA